MDITILSRGDQGLIEIELLCKKNDLQEVP